MTSYIPAAMVALVTTACTAGVVASKDVSSQRSGETPVVPTDTATETSAASTTATGTVAGTSTATSATLTVTLAGLPPVDAEVAPLAVTVGGDGVTQYRHALAAGDTCPEALPEVWTPVAAPIADAVSAPGSYVLCVQGKADDARTSAVVSHTFFALGWVELAATATARSETEVAVQWAAPAFDVVRFDVHAASDRTTLPASLPAANVAEADATGDDLAGLAPGTLGRVTVRARVRTTETTTVAPANFFTPYGALNVTTVNQTPWNVGGAGTTVSTFYAEAMAVSAKWSMFWTGYYWPQLGPVYAGLPTQPLQKPAYNFLSTAIAPTTHWFASGLEDISQIWTDGVSKVAIALSSGRLLLYNHLPTTPETRDPDLVLGQASFTSTGNNRGGAAGASTLSGLGGVCYDGTTLYVADAGNNRILGWNGWPTANGEAADFVLGQPDFTSTSARHGQAGADLTTLDSPGNIACYGGKLVVPEQGNHRVLVWNTAPTTSGVAASFVLGQTTTSGDAPNITGDHNNPFGNWGTPTAQSLFNPNSAVMVPKTGGGWQLIVGDMYNSRIVQWDTFPTATGQAADRVYGQPNFGTNASPNPPAPTADTVQCAWFLANELDDQGAPTQYFWVADGCSNNRHLRWQVNQPAAAMAIDMASLTDTNSYGAYSDNLHHRSQWWSGRHRVGVDPASGFVHMSDLAWSSLPADGNVDGVGGFGTGLLKAGGRLYWISGNFIKSQPFAAASLAGVTATPDISVGYRSPTDGHGADASGYDDLAHNIAPSAILVNGGRLYALDGPRIAIWNTLPTADHPAIDAVIGQSATNQRTANSGGISASSLGDNAAAMAVLGGKLYVTDTANNRVLVWNTVPTTSTPADLVLGQTAFSANGSGTDLAHMSAPAGVALLNGKLIVADSGNGRLLIWDTVPTASGTPASREYVIKNERYALPAWFNGDYLKPYDLAVTGGKLVVGMQDRSVILPDLWP